jgi:hypothetical protein
MWDGKMGKCTTTKGPQASEWDADLFAGKYYLEKLGQFELQKAKCPLSYTNTFIY